MVRLWQQITGSTGTMCPGQDLDDVAWVWLLRSEYRMRERAVLVVRVVQAVRSGAVRAGPVTTSM